VINLTCKCSNEFITAFFNCHIHFRSSSIVNELYSIQAVFSEMGRGTNPFAPKSPVGVFRTAFQSVLFNPYLPNTVTFLMPNRRLPYVYHCYSQAAVFPASNPGAF
jgi:hypothetical protein